ncbi:MAG: potassium-transporting ATPase subunit F, partial [Desulfobaccales bacterium]
FVYLVVALIRPEWF